MTEQFDDENVMSTFITSGLHLPLYQDPHELKRRRNRLAQRKHRQRISTGSSIDRKRQQDPACLPTPAESEISANLSWDTTLSHDSLASFEEDNGKSGSSMTFSLPIPEDEDGNSSVTSPELEQVTSRIWQRSLESLDMGIVVDMASNTRGAYCHQQYPDSAQEMFEQAAEFNISSAQSLLASVGPQVMRTMPAIFNSPDHATNISELGQLYQPPLTRLATSEIQSYANDNYQLSTSEVSPERSPKQLRESTRRSGYEDPVTLECRFDRVMKAVEEAGFESIDDLARQYYTASFKEDTKPYWAQARSRTRSLPIFLASLHESSKTWTNRDAQGYRQQITNIAESIYVCEFATAKEDMMMTDEPSVQGSEQQRTPLDRHNEKGVEDLWTVITDLDINQDLKRQKTMIREKMPEIWSLLVELTQQTGLCHSRASQAVGTFLLLLVGSRIT